MVLPRIEFAPLFVPLDRRLQTLAIVGLVLTQAFGPLITTLLTYFLVFHTRLWWIWLLYIAWYLTLDRNALVCAERRSPWVRNWTWWFYAKDYFPLRLIKHPETELDPKRNYLFGCFPHGMLSTGAFLTMATNAAGFPKLFPHHKPYIHTISFFFWFPLLRELGFWLGGLSVSRNALNHVLANKDGGNVSALVVGGAAESYFCRPGVHKIYYENRKGFVKVALKNGSPLVPVYCFGENDLYSQLEFDETSFIGRNRTVVNRWFGFSLIFPIGRGIFQYSFGLLPRRRSVNVVVGEPIDVEKTENPSQEQIDTLHHTFKEKLLELFERNKKNYLVDYDTVHLEIV